MSTSPYDTHAGVKRLTEAGMPATQAEAVINENLQLMADRLATKDEFQQGLAALGQNMREGDGHLQAQILELRNEIVLLREEARTREYRMVAEVAGVVATLLAVFGAVIQYLR